MRLITDEQHRNLCEALTRVSDVDDDCYILSPNLADTVTEAIDTLQALPEVEVVATQWLQHGVMVNAFPRIPESPEVYDPDGFWGAKGYSKAPLYATKEPS